MSEDKWKQFIYRNLIFSFCPWRGGLGVGRVRSVVVGERTDVFTHGVPQNMDHIPMFLLIRGTTQKCDQNFHLFPNRDRYHDNYTGPFLVWEVCVPVWEGWDHWVGETGGEGRLTFYFEQQIKWEVKGIHICGGRWNQRLQVKTVGSPLLGCTGLCGELEHQKISTRLIGESFECVMGECVI